jgi:hypothetical protein
MVYYWNTDTDETTEPGALEPQHWVSVRDDETGQDYWWCPATNETTELGAPMPHYLDTHLPRGNGSPYIGGANEPQSFGGQMKSMFFMGIGMSLAFGMVRMVVG